MSRSARTPGLSRQPLVARTVTPRGTGIVMASLGVHMLVLGVLGYMPSPANFLARRAVEMEIVAPEPVETPPPPPPRAPEPVPPKAVAPKAAAPKPVAPTPEPPKAAPPAAAEAPVDFTGVTLTADGSGWSSAVGNGDAMRGPVGRIAKVTGHDRAGTGDGQLNAPPPVVAEASLSRKPVPPPDMDALLEKNFPARARTQGVSGSALLRVRIMADGRATDMQVVRETGDYGFGEACIKTLRMRRWQAPLDRQGHPVATDIRYACEFEVGY
jgi:protein TonB